MKTEVDLYYEVCNIFDLVEQGKESVEVLEQKAIDNNINLNDFCDANDLGICTTWKEAVREYNRQIADNER